MGRRTDKGFISKNRFSMILAVVLTLAVAAVPLEEAAAAPEPEEGAVSEIAEEPENIVDGEIIVVYDDAGVSEKKSEKIQKEAEEALSDIDIEVSEEVVPAENDQGTVVTAQIPEELSVKEAVSQVMEDENVSYAQPNFVYELMEDPVVEEVNDSYVQNRQTYYLDNAGVTAPMWQVL